MINCNCFMCNHGNLITVVLNLVSGMLHDSNFVRSVSGLPDIQGDVKSQSHYPPCLVDHIELFLPLKLVQPSPGISIIRDSHIVLSKRQ